MWGRFFRAIKNIFSKPVSKPVEEVKPEPVTQLPLPIVTPSEPEAPTDHEKDTVDNGNTRNPDWQYIADNATIDVNRMSDLSNICHRLRKGEATYYSFTSALTGMPMDLVQALHYREDSTLSFDTMLHNGEKLPGPTRLEPKGRGPFHTWPEAAADAIELKKHLFPRNPDGTVKHRSQWTMGDKLKLAELYNGLGYRKSGEYSPYVCAGTNFHDETGKYVRDGKYRSSAPEKQLGVLAILLGLELKL